MPPGGKRIGAGRPKGSKNKKTLEQIAARERFTARVYEQFDPLMDALMRVAKGGEETRPDPVSLKYLFDQAIGQPTQKIAGDSEQPLSVLVRNFMTPPKDA